MSSNNFALIGRTGFLPQKGQVVMRSSFATLVVLLLAATMAVAQAYPSPNQAPNPYGQPQAQSGTPNHAPSASSGKPQAPSSTAGGHKVLQAKSQEELKAYQD